MKEMFIQTRGIRVGAHGTFLMTRGEHRKQKDFQKNVLINSLIQPKRCKWRSFDYKKALKEAKLKLRYIKSNIRCPSARYYAPFNAGKRHSH